VVRVAQRRTVGEVARLVSLMFDEEAGEEIEDDSYEGPGTSRFSI
jgi:hypothetical protein